MSYRQANNLIVLVLLMISAVLTGISAATPESLGLSPKVINWLGIFSLPIGVALSQLNPLRREPPGGDDLNE